MPRLREDAIASADLLEYLNGYSDFSFELQTLSALRALGLDCEHAGLYEDPTTKKTREFDIRATARVDNYCVRLAIECKNIREYFPLLVSCVPRHEDESFHEIAIVSEPTRGMFYIPPAMQTRATVVRLRTPDSCYVKHSPVGKALAQVGRAAEKDATIYASDSDVFDKWAQCLASAADLVVRSYWEGDNDEERVTFAWVLPVIVVPDGRLWVVEYDADGTRKNEPRQTNHCSLFVNKIYSMNPVAGPSLSVSHVDIMTSIGLTKFAADYLRTKGGMEIMFPPAAFKKQQAQG